MRKEVKERMKLLDRLVKIIIDRNIWNAIDVDNREIIAIHVSITRTSLDALYFLRRILECCEDEPLILVDGGP
ncbi:MAG TPA: hypothetical protein ENG60_02855 [Thermoplasmatales archaeon]|nr:hypothetical protein [Thermoplasmatales archaeon]HEX17334.1 hypothetical protein [Thermoplasmatales archaeon]